MKTRKGLIAIVLITSSTFALAEKPHPEVSKAMNYELPELTCKQPQLPGVSKDVIDPATGAVNRADIDSYTLGRFERAEKRWKKCLTKYKNKLMDDFKELQGSAVHGVTQSQARTIMTNMKSIQLAIESPTGEPVPPAT